MQVIVDGLVTSYEKSGTGKRTILFLHGWGDSIAGFKSLGKLGEDQYTSILLDLPGFGRTDKPPKAWDLPDYSHFVAEFIKKIDIEPYAIIGHSNGGAIAINSIASENIRTKKLVLIASSGVREGKTAKKNARKIGAKFGKIFVSVLPSRTQNKIKKNLYERIGSDYMVVEGLQETFKSIVNYDVSKEAAKIAVPTLLIYGSKDLVTPVWQGKILSKAIKNSRLKIIEGAEHFPHHQQPKKIKKMVEEFLK